MRQDERYLSAAETAKALGVSKRTLRFYEQKGLIKPLRSESGRLAYGAEALARLHQILALKHMGFELSKIARLLKGALSSLDSVLALQEQNLAARHAETHRALNLVRRARSRLSSGEALSVDDLTTLTRETTMDSKELDRLLEPYLRKHFTPEEARKLNLSARFTKPGFLEEWLEARSALEAAMKTGDASSPAALKAARMTRVARERFGLEGTDLIQRVKRMFEEAKRDPAIADTALDYFLMTPELYDFAGRAMSALTAQEAERFAARRTG